MSINLSHSELRAFEKYVLSDRKLDDALKMLVEGSDAYNYLRFLHILTEKGQFTADEKKQFESFLEKSYNAAISLELRSLFLSYDTATDQEAKNSILTKITDKFLRVTFNDMKPQELTSGESAGTEENASLNQVLDTVDLKNEIEKLYKGEEYPYNFKPEALLEIEFDKLTPDIFMQVLNLLNKNVARLDSKSFYKAFTEYVNDKKVKYNYYNWDMHLLGNMTLQQMNKLKDFIPDALDDPTFAGCFFQKKFHKELNPNQDELTLKEKRQNLISMYEFSSTMPKKASGLKSSLLLEILENGIQQDLYEEKYFNEYLKTPLRMSICKKVAETSGDEWNSYIAPVRSKEYKTGGYAADKKDREIFEEYLDKLFRAGKKPEDYYEYLDKAFLTEKYEEVQMLSGKKVEVNYSNASRLDNIKNRVMLNVCKFNKEAFNLGDEIEIFIDVKNVPSLIVKVFYVNAENYYRKNLATFKSNINLDGFMATIEKTVNYSQSQSVVHRELLKFPELKSKNGLYIIEMIGNGKSSRAVLKIGTLSLVSKSTVAGIICYILDSTHRICSGSKTGIWLLNKFYPADQTSEKLGRILVPYSDSNRISKAILLHEGMAQLVDFNEEMENYELQCGFLLHPDSMVMRGKATILVRPQLYINNQTADITLLQNAKVIITSQNYTDSIPVTKIFDEFKLVPNKEIELSFNVMAHMQCLNVKFDAEITKLTNNEKLHLSHERTFDIKTHENDTIIDELHLRSVNPGPTYEILVLGKNGEPVPHIITEVNFTQELMNTSIRREYKTDTNGIIKLGKLQGITNINANTHKVEGQVYRSWDIPSKIFFSLPSNIDLLEDEAIELPWTMNIKPSLFSIDETEKIMSDFTSNIKLLKNNNAYSLVRIESLKEGKYAILGLDLKNSYIIITVHKGKIWEGKSTYLAKPSELLEIPQKGMFTRIKNVSIIEENKVKEPNIQVEIESSNLQDCRVHIVLYNFLCESMKTLSKGLDIVERCDMSSFPIQKWKNFYMSNRALSSELRYCIDRKQMEKITGNTLEKPPLILKGTFLQNTSVEVERTTEGTEFESYEELVVQQKQSMHAKQEMLHRYQDQARFKNIQMECEMPRCDECDDKPMERFGGGHIDQQNCVVEYQNFMPSPCTFWNAKPNSSGLVSFNIPKDLLQQFSGIYALAIGPGGIAHFIHPLNPVPDKLKKKDLSLQKSFEADKNYSEARVAVGVEKNDSHIIEDITSTHFTLVDSIWTTYNVLHELAEAKGCINELEQFEFLTCWPEFSADKKLKIFTKYMSHELNLFLYKKDPDFFTKVVKPHLSNKMEKDFMDSYLLGLPLEKFYEAPYKFGAMNQLEKALLIEYLVKHEKLEKAKQYATLLSVEFPEQKDINPEETNIVFDTVLLQNALRDKKSELERIISESLKEEDEEAKYREGGGGGGIAEECEECEDEGMESKEVARGGARRRKPQRRIGGECGEGYYGEGEYQPMEKRAENPYALNGQTKEYMETGWYSLAICDKPSSFSSLLFSDYAIYVIELAQSKTAPKSFLSHNFTSCVESFVPAIAALALLDLPFAPGEHGYKSVGERSHEIKAASNFLIFKKAIKQCPADMQSSLLVGQRYLEALQIGGEDVEVTEFLTRKVYRGQTVITNISGETISFSVLVQVPQGSLPVGATSYQKAFPMTLNSFTTTKLEYQFYFPAPGKFVHASPMISYNYQVIAKGKQNVINVATKKTKVNVEDFRDVVANCTPEKILEFLRDHPIESITAFSWNYLYWMLSDQKFWSALIKLMRSQGRFERRVWEYALYHKKDQTTIKEYFKSSESLKRQLGYWFKSSLIEVTPEDSQIRHLHYFPLINQRVHRVASSNPNDPSILNVNMRDSYYKLIQALSQKKTLDSTDKLCLCYYLILQDRISESNKIFTTIQYKQLPKSGKLKLQYDYMNAYLDFYNGYPKFTIARKVVEEHKDCPIFSWNLRFCDIEQQLRDFDGIEDEEEKDNGKSNLLKKKKKPIEELPEMHVTMQNKEVCIEYTRVLEIEVKYYLVDLEVRFSRGPFISQESAEFCYVQPTMSNKFTLDQKQKLLKIPMPKEFANKNVIVEVRRNDGNSKIVTSFSSSLKVHIYENYGELQVMDNNGKLLPEVYVKVFSQNNSGETKFYKDGYTDIRGRFDYSTLNENALNDIKKFSILLMSEEYGSVIKECKAPEGRKKIVSEQLEVQGRLKVYSEAMSKSKGGWKKSEKQKYYEKESK